MSMWDNIAIPIGIEQTLRSIFAGILIGGIDRNKPGSSELVAAKVQSQKFCRSKFVSTFGDNIFNDIYAIFYQIITELNVKVFTSEQLESIIDNNRDLILESPYINKNTFIVSGGSVLPNDDDIINAVTSMAKEQYIELSNIYISEDEFNSACEIYKSWYIENYMFYVSNNMTMIMSDIGFDCKLPGKRTRHYQGSKDAREYYNQQMLILDGLEGTNRFKVVEVDDTWLENELDSSKRPNSELLFDTGLKEIDSVWRPFKRSEMLCILGPTKGGKTKFAQYICGRAIKNGYNVLVWVLEGSRKEWESGIVANVIADTSYNEVKKTGKGSVLRISAAAIEHNELAEKASASKIIASAKTVMATDENYGRLRFVDDSSAYVEDFTDLLLAEYNRKPFDVLIIDPIVKILSKNHMGKTDRIAEAYIKLEQFLKHQTPVHIFGVVTAQFKQEVIDAMRRDPEGDIDITSGGDSAETVRTPDKVIGLFSSKEERSADIMKFYSVAQRGSEAFKNFVGRCYLDCSYFMSESDEV